MGPESPRYLLLAAQRADDSNGAQTRADNAATPHSGSEADDALEPLVHNRRCCCCVCESDPTAPSFGVLVSPTLRTTSLLLWTVWFGANIGMQCFNTYLPTLMKREGVPEGGMYRDVCLYSSAGVPGCFLAAYIVERPRTGRR